jgi:hypothetical protein
VETTGTGIMPYICCYKHKAGKRCACNVNRIGRQHVTTTITDIKPKTMPKEQLFMGITIRYQTKR